MSHVEFKKWPMSYVADILMSIGFMSHVNFKKRSCLPVDFRVRGPNIPSTASQVGRDYVVVPESDTGWRRFRHIRCVSCDCRQRAGVRRSDTLY